jgi:hypothetical protein
MTAIVGFVTLILLWYKNDVFPTPKQFVVAFMFLSVGPAICVLLLGWVVAGFWKSD